MSLIVKSKRRSSEKRKEKSRDAARCRRSHEAEIFKDLANQLPVQVSLLSQLDKSSIVRLVIAHIRLRHILGAVDSPKENPSTGFKQKIDQLHFKTLDGFLLLVEKCGEVIYVSDNIEKYLGITQVDVLGQNIFDFLHPCDHEELNDLLCNKIQQPGGSDEDIVRSFVRMKCTLTVKGHNVNLKSASYKVIEIAGRTTNRLNHSDDLSYAILVGQPLPDLTLSELCLDQRMFVSRHSLDLHFTYCDNEVVNLLGFSPEDLMGKSVFKFHHAYDAEVIDKACKTLFIKGESKTGLYRFLAKNGGYVWMDTHATLVGEAVCERLKCIVCINHVISGIEYPEQMFSDVQIAPDQNIIDLVSNEYVIEDDPDEVIVYEEDSDDCADDGCFETMYSGMQFVTEKLIGIKAAPVSYWSEQHNADSVPFNTVVVKPYTSVTDDQEDDPTVAGITITRSMPLLDESTLEELVSLENRAPYIPMDDDMCFGSLPVSKGSCIESVVPGCVTFTSGPIDDDDDIMSIIKTFDSAGTPDAAGCEVLLHDTVLSAGVSLKRALSEKELLLAAANSPMPMCKVVKRDNQRNITPVPDASVMAADTSGSSVLRNLLTTGVDINYGYKLKDVYCPVNDAELSNRSSSDYDSLDSYSPIMSQSEDMTTLLVQLLNPTSTSADLSPEQNYLADAADLVYVITTA